MTIVEEIKKQLVRHGEETKYPGEPGFSCPFWSKKSFNKCNFCIYLFPEIVNLIGCERLCPCDIFTEFEKVKGYDEDDAFFKANKIVLKRIKEKI